jgi:hypothetical protein
MRPRAHRQYSTEDHSSPGAPTPGGCRPETPSTDESLERPPTFRPASPREPPLLLWLRRRMRSFQPAFTHTLCTLGPGPDGYSPRDAGPQEAHRLLQSKTVREHTSERAKLRHSRRRQANCWSEDAARERSAHQAFTGQGPHALRSCFRPPPRRPLASVDLPQPDRPEHPLSQTHARHGVEPPCPAPMR